MTVASLDLCRELYELSGWGGCWLWHAEESSGWILLDGDSFDSSELDGYPAYDIGYLLRKLPHFVDSKVYADRPACLDIGLRDDGPPWFAWYAVLGIQDVESDFGVHADTPEDAACRLAIELFKQGILTREGESAA